MAYAIALRVPQYWFNRIVTVPATGQAKTNLGTTVMNATAREIAIT